MNDAEISDLCIISRYREAKKGEMIFFTGDVEDRIYILKVGVVKIIQTAEDGTEILKDVIHQSDIFGYLPNSASRPIEEEYAVAASELVSICTFRRADFEQVLQQNPTISLKLATHLGDKMRVLEQKYNSLIFKDVKRRLFDFLQDYVKQFRLQQDQNKAPNHLTQEDIAQLIGASRQSVASLIADLEREGVIKYSRKEIALV